MFFVYILKSDSLNKYYVGHTDDIDKRISEHNSKRKHWTSNANDWCLFYKEEFESRSEAMKRERYIKSFKNIKKFLDFSQ